MLPLQNRQRLPFKPIIIKPGKYRPGFYHTWEGQKNARKGFFMSFQGEIIRSRQNKYISLLCSLERKKARDETGLFRFDGVKLFCEAVRHEVEISFVVICKSAEEQILSKIRDVGGFELSQDDFHIICVSDDLFEKISEEKSPEGIICVAKHIDKFHKIVKIYNEGEISLLSSEKILLLDSLRDPQNVGAVIRSAAAFGVDRVIMSADCADIYNPKTLRSCMGTLFGMKVDRVESLPEAVCILQRAGRHVYAATLGEKCLTLGEDELLADSCVVIGNEGHGVGEKTVSVCSGCVMIPMSDGVESLNASTAATVFLWEFFGKKKRY